MSPLCSSQGILSIETSCADASLSLMIGGEECFSSRWTALRSHNSRIFDALAEIKPFLDNAPPSLILVGAGPGSYSGIRVALAAADGLSLVYDAPVVALCSWEALPHHKGDALIISDARRGGWAVSRLNAGKWDGNLKILTAESAREEIDRALANNIPVLSCEPGDKLAAQGWTQVRAGLAPEAVALVRSWLDKTPEEQAFLKTGVPSPLYVREPHITPAKKAAWEKASAHSSN